MQDARRRIVRRVNVVHDEQQRAFFGRRCDRLQERVGQSQRGNIGRPVHRLRHARKRLKDLGADPRQLAQRFRVRRTDRPLRRQLAYQLGEDGERQLALGVVGLCTGDNASLHLTSGGEGVGERRLAHAGVPGEDDDAGGTAPHVHPGVVQAAELALTTDEKLAFESPLRRLRLLGDARPGRRPPSLPEEVGHTQQVGGGLGGEFLGEQGLIPGERLERIAPVADERPSFHQAPDGILAGGVEIVQHLGAPLHRLEIPDPARAVHLADQRVAKPRRQPGLPLVLPLLEGARLGDLESLEEAPAHLETVGL